MKLIENEWGVCEYKFLKNVLTHIRVIVHQILGWCAKSIIAPDD